ncbi:MAG: ABC transporter ATP-binding protein, partial [Victivallaceae bacterium]
MQLEGKHLQCSYGGNVVVEDFNMKFPSGTITAVLGPNGCGKSTLLRSLGRLLPLRCGVVELDKLPADDYSRVAFARKLASLGQLHHTPPDMTVEELVAQGRYPQRN